MKKKLITVILVVAIMVTGCSSTESAETSIYAVDIDLTSFSTTIAYSELINILNNPEDYTGKIIKIAGDYYNFTNEDGSAFYPACIVSDVAACCSQGMEFVLDDEAYPTEGTPIIVSGKFESYVDQYDNQIYYHLADAILQ